MLHGPTLSGTMSTNLSRWEPFILVHKMLTVNDLRAFPALLLRWCCERIFRNPLPSLATAVPRLRCAQNWRKTDDFRYLFRSASAAKTCNSVSLRITAITNFVTGRRLFRPLDGPAELVWRTLS